MPITEADVDALKLRIMELEKIVGELGKALSKNPDSTAIEGKLTEAKDEIAKLNLRLEQLEKPIKGDNHAGDNQEDYWPC